MARVAIIDDEGVFRVGLRDVLNSTPGVNVIGDGPDSSRVTLDADVLVIAEMSGLWRHLVTDHNLSSQSRAFVVILDAPDDVTLARARELGVASCVPRSATPEAFVRAIKHAVRLVKSPVGNEHVEPDRAMPAPVQSFSTARELPQDGVEADGATDTNGSPDTVPMSPLGARDVEILACVAGRILQPTSWRPAWTVRPDRQKPLDVNPAQDWSRRPDRSGRDCHQVSVAYD